MTHRAQVVDLVGLDQTHQIGYADATGEVTVMQVQVRVFVHMLDPAAIERRGSSDQSVHIVSLAQEQLG